MVSPTIRLATLLTALGLLVTVTGCDLLTDPHGGLLEDLERNRAIWEAQRPAQYTYVIEHRCFCPQEAVGPTRVEVDGTTVVSQVYSTSGEPVEPGFQDVFPAVEELFSILEDAANAGADEIDATFDSELGLPVDFFIDFSDGVADEERGYRVLELPTAVTAG